jgi:hypothetical protein
MAANFLAGAIIRGIEVTWHRLLFLAISLTWLNFFLANAAARAKKFFSIVGISVLFSAFLARQASPTDKDTEQNNDKILAPPP